MVFAIYAKLFLVILSLNFQFSCVFYPRDDNNEDTIMSDTVVTRYSINTFCRFEFERIVIANQHLGLLVQYIIFKCQNSAETKIKFVTPNPFIYCNISSTAAPNLKQINFFCKSTKKYKFINVKTPRRKTIKHKS